MIYLQVDIDNIENDAFLRQILWTDECTFHSDGKVNRHNEHHYAVENPHCRKEVHVQGRFAVNVWMGIVDNYVIGPYFCEVIKCGKLFRIFRRLFTWVARKCPARHPSTYNISTGWSPGSYITFGADSFESHFPQSMDRHSKSFI